MITIDLSTQVHLPTRNFDDDICLIQKIDDINIDDLKSDKLIIIRVDGISTDEILLRKQQYQTRIIDLMGESYNNERIFYVYVSSIISENQFIELQKSYYDNTCEWYRPDITMGVIV